MKTKEMIRTILVAGGVIAALAVSALAQESAALQPMEANGVTYVSGGVGTDERSALEATKSQYNLHVLNSSANGDLTTDDTLTVTDRAGQPVITLNDAGPLVYMKLPPGSYTVTATIADRSKQQKITVGGKSANVGFRW